MGGRCMRAGGVRCPTISREHAPTSHATQTTACQTGTSPVAGFRQFRSTSTEFLVTRRPAATTRRLTYPRRIVWATSTRHHVAIHAHAMVTTVTRLGL